MTSERAAEARDLSTSASSISRGYIHVDGHTYSVPYQLLGKPVEVRESKDAIRVFRGPRKVAVHDKSVSTLRHQRRTLAAHRPPRGHGATPAQVLPEERELAAAGPPFADYAAAVKQRGGLRWPAALDASRLSRRPALRPAR